MRPRLRRGIFGPDEARGASARAPEHTLQRSVRSEQRRLGQKEPPPEGLRRFSVLASLLLGHSPTAGDAPSSRLARTENRRNKRGRIYGTGYLGSSMKMPVNFVDLGGRSCARAGCLSIFRFSASRRAVHHFFPCDP